MSVRVRFAPSPTGGLHLGGVRTVLYNYLFAKHNGGEFVLRIEDTDQTRYVPGAEEYIQDCLRWCGLTPDESPVHGGEYGPYRQSERKPQYRAYAEQLVQDGYAYYAFDTPEELEAMRERYKSDENPSPQYDHRTRKHMRNSISLTENEVKALLDAGTPHVIRIKMPANELVKFTDMIRGEVSFQTGIVDDKVLLKADQMPTYHLAVVVDDYLMKITHAFRGEEWLPSAPVHILLWHYLGWGKQMPQWAHLPLILKPDGHGKLSKRDGDRLGFPVFAMNWTDPKTGETTQGFKEKGFLPEAFVNLLAMLGWNDGTDQEVFSMEELIDRFSMDRVHKAGAKFDFEKAKWFNHQWMQRISLEQLTAHYRQWLTENQPDIANQYNDAYLQTVVALVKDRCSLIPDLFEQSSFFYTAPTEWDLTAIQPKWNEAKQGFFNTLLQHWQQEENWQADALEAGFKTLATAQGIKVGELQLPLRIMLVGGKFGPTVFHIAATIGKTATLNRISALLAQLS